MSDTSATTANLNQADDDILVAEVSDESLESAAGGERPKFTYGGPLDFLPC